MSGDSEARKAQIRQFSQIPGKRWRLSAEPGNGRTARYEAHNVGLFDELVVDHWFHMEKMASHRWWMRLGQRTFWIEIERTGEVKISEEPAEDGA